jgi:hypothetical protein
MERKEGREEKVQGEREFWPAVKRRMGQGVWAALRGGECFGAGTLAGGPWVPSVGSFGVGWQVDWP